ncbi:hypothetical protein GCM10011510_00830 [Streptococcus himalayensis]|uniref:Uncharacterized protein n=1 Tax=Streptococcus himalayensis TaxID=1888195 RepID=A0A917A2K9_9STRE|nr:hypothetical protein GCM10011510_00830 [Streptococcus himalayensis]
MVLVLQSINLNQVKNKEKSSGELFWFHAERSVGNSFAYMFTEFKHEWYCPSGEMLRREGDLKNLGSMLELF